MLGLLLGDLLGGADGLLLGWDVAAVGGLVGPRLGCEVAAVGEAVGVAVSSHTMLSTGDFTLTGALTVSNVSTGLVIVGDSLASISKRVTSMTVGVIDTPQSAPPSPSNKANIRSLDPSPSLVVWPVIRISPLLLTAIPKPLSTLVPVSSFAH